MNVSFEHPFLIGLGGIVIALALCISRYFQNTLTVYIPLGPPGGIPFKPPLKIEYLIKVLHGLELIGILLLFIAAAGPLSITTETVWLNRGADIIFVLDISPSMAALDMGNQNRFTVARNLVQNFAANRPADAIGLVAVGNDAALLLPPTIDRQSLFSRLKTLHIGELGDGTALGMGLAIAGLHISNSAAPRRVVVLITDGENNAGAIHPETAAAVIPTLGASLWVIGVGSHGEVPLDYVDPYTKIRRIGTFDSRFNQETLEAIAYKGDGSYIAAPSAEAFFKAFSRIDEDEMTIGRSGTITRTKGFHGPFIISALMLLVLVRLVRRYILGSFL